MDFYSLSVEKTAITLNSSISTGLTAESVKGNGLKWGNNSLSKREKETLLSKIFKTLSEPMLLILIASFMITFGINLGKLLKSGSADFTESLGILSAILLSALITLIMEGSSEKAFQSLNKIYSNNLVKVLRNGEISFISQTDLVVGDVVILSSGDKISADGRLIYSNGFSTNESALTGESNPSEKDFSVILNDGVYLAERKNMVYSGTFAISGEAKMIVTAVGDNTEIGKIAGELKREKEISSPLSEKMNKLSKRVTLIGTITALFVTLLSLIRLIIEGGLSFSSVQSLFVSCIVLIVASVPEGLPTIVAVSLALNMIKLSKENALIKKMIATETAGAVSVICTDKTGTLTTGNMEVEKVCLSNYCLIKENIKNEFLIANFLLNTTAEKVVNKSKAEYRGNPTECALLKRAEKQKGFDIFDFKSEYKIISRTPFDNEKKYMTTTVEKNGERFTLIKGAPERVLDFCSLSESQKKEELKVIGKEQKRARRALCFCHSEGENYIYDGFVTIFDPIRPEVYRAVSECKKAGIKIKILTGDNILTAEAIARDLGIIESENQVINASDLERLDEKGFEKILNKISVISRSTPLIKMRVVESLKRGGEVVAVTGDGINDAPAIRQADVGIAMGKTGSDITKETADVVLLDDSFYTIVKAISFGRNVYRNLQRFIVFQLSVNFTALLIITVTAILGYPVPFNTLQLLWINVIMDGPPALTLGLENSSFYLMNNKPIKREASIVTFRLLCRIAVNGLFMGGVILLQYLYNFLSVSEEEKAGAVFTLFILFQLFNAFNSRELGAKSIAGSLNKNKIMLFAFILTFLIHVFIEQVLYKPFCVYPLSFLTWIKLILTAFSIILLSEITKFFIRLYKGKN